MVAKTLKLKVFKPQRTETQRRVFPGRLCGFRAFAFQIPLRFSGSFICGFKQRQRTEMQFNTALHFVASNNDSNMWRTTASVQGLIGPTFGSQSSPCLRVSVVKTKIKKI
jgi:hypothetical protein